MKPSERIAEIKKAILEEQPPRGYALFLGGGDEAMTKAILRYLDEQAVEQGGTP